MPLSEKEKAIRRAARAAARLRGRKLGPERDRFYADVISAHDAGASFREIAAGLEGSPHPLSPQRVHQIVRDFAAA